MYDSLGNFGTSLDTENPDIFNLDIFTKNLLLRNFLVNKGIPCIPITSSKMQVIFKKEEYYIRVFANRRFPLVSRVIAYNGDVSIQEKKHQELRVLVKVPFLPSTSIQFILNSN